MAVSAGPGRLCLSQLDQAGCDRPTTTRQAMAVPAGPGRLWPSQQDQEGYGRPSRTRQAMAVRASPAGYGRPSRTRHAMLQLPPVHNPIIDGTDGTVRLYSLKLPL